MNASARTPRTRERARTPTAGVAAPLSRRGEAVVRDRQGVNSTSQPPSDSRRRQGRGEGDHHRAGKSAAGAPTASSQSLGGRIRCAIYTRKSSEEGLEQEFNSLDAQREACEAYVRSQKHAGWRALPQLYDDPGYSGGTMERPALKRLLADIAAKQVEVVVVYETNWRLGTRLSPCN
jgi:Resolvase, N terminal domain